MMNYLQAKKKAMLNYVSGGRLPSEYQEVEWIESSGTQYLTTTDITPKTTQTYYIKYANLQNPNQVTFGSRTSGSYSSSKNQVYHNLNAGRTYINLGQMSTNLHSTSLDTVYEETLDHINYNSNCDNTGTRPFFVFALNNQGSASARAYIQLYAFKITENGIDVLNLIPCYRKSDSEVGMYDTVSKTFLTNQGTGTFTKGQDV